MGVEDVKWNWVFLHDFKVLTKSGPELSDRSALT